MPPNRPCALAIHKRGSGKFRSSDDSGRMVGYTEVILQPRSRSNRSEPSRHLDDELAYVRLPQTPACAASLRCENDWIPRLRASTATAAEHPRTKYKGAAL